MVTAATPQSNRYIIGVREFSVLKKHTKKNLDDQSISEISKDQNASRTIKNLMQRISGNQSAHKKLAEIFLNSQTSFPKLKDIAGKVLVENYPFYIRQDKILKKYNRANKKGKTRLHYAAKGGNLKDVKVIIDHDPSLLSVKDESGRTPLHVAAKYGSIEIVKMIIEYSKEVNDSSLLAATDCDLNTFAHYAAKHDHLDLIHITIDHVPLLLEARDSYDSTPLHLAVRCNHNTIVQTLIAHNFSFLLAKDKGGSNPLHVAAMYGYLSIVLIINKSIKKMNDPSPLKAQDTLDQTPLEVAKRYNRDVIIHEINACNLSVFSPNNRFHESLRS